MNEAGREQRRVFSVGCVALAVQVLGLTGGICAQQPLFESTVPLELRLEAPFRRMIVEKEGRFPARMFIDGSPSDTIHLEISPRGKTRLRSGICDMPGLMLFFTSGTQDGPFAGQESIPAVTYCKDSDSYEQLAILEYLAYRIYNVVTDLSLRVRLARIEYVDSERERSVAERYGFFLEHWDYLLERNGWRLLRFPVVPPDEYDESQRNVFEVFQYLIGNTDWSYSRPPPDENGCCHNSLPVGNPKGPLFPVPFDFDHAGIVDAPYATTDRSLPIRRVRERLYRGICGSPASLNATLGTFEIHRTEIQMLFEEATFLSARSRDRALRYIADFYEIISDDRRVQSELLSTCRTPE